MCWLAPEHGWGAIRRCAESRTQTTRPGAALKAGSHKRNTAALNLRSESITHLLKAGKVLKRIRQEQDGKAA